MDFKEGESWWGSRDVTPLTAVALMVLVTDALAQPSPQVEEHMETLRLNYHKSPMACTDRPGDM